MRVAKFTRTRRPISPSSGRHHQIQRALVAKARPGLAGALVRQGEDTGDLHGRPGATSWSRDAPGGSRPRRCPRGWWHLLAEARGSQGGYRRHGCARCWRVLWRSLGCPFRKASLVRVLWSLSFLVLPGIRCQNSTQIRDDDAVVRAGRYAATRVNLWMVVGLRFAVTAMDRILTLKLVDGSDGLTT
jgi:hypothetical protein